MPKIPTPETTQENDPNLMGLDRIGQHGYQDDKDEDNYAPVASDTIPTAPPPGPNKTLEGLMMPKDKYSVSEIGTETTDDKKSLSKSSRTKERIRKKKRKVIKSLVQIFADSRKRQINYINMLKESYQEGKRKGYEVQEARRNKQKRTTRIIKAIKRNRERRSRN